MLESLNEGVPPLPRGDLALGVCAVRWKVSHCSEEARDKNLAVAHDLRNCEQKRRPTNQNTIASMRLSRLIGWTLRGCTTEVGQAGS